MRQRLLRCVLVAWLLVLPTGWADAQSVLASGETLSADQSRTSSSGRYTLLYQSDGNLVLYDNYGGPVWASSTFSGPGVTAMQGDGNLVVYDASWTPLWASGTSGHHGAYLEVHDDGAIVVRSPQGAALWAAPFTPTGPPGTEPVVLLINGSFAQSPAGWTAPGSPEFNAIAASYGVSPDPWPWTSNGFWDVMPPYYDGIWYGGWQLANFLASLPAGEVNIISHSHGGNVVLASQVLVVTSDPPVHPAGDTGELGLRGLAVRHRLHRQWEVSGFVCFRLGAVLRRVARPDNVFRSLAVSPARGVPGGVRAHCSGAITRRLLRGSPARLSREWLLTTGSGQRKKKLRAPTSCSAKA